MSLDEHKVHLIGLLVPHSRHKTKLQEYPAQTSSRNRQNFLGYRKIYPPTEPLNKADFNIFVFSNAGCNKKLSVAKPAMVLTWHNNCSI